MAAPTVPPPIRTSAQPRPGSRLIRLYRTTIGKKAVMAVTGIVFLLFLIAHMIGNLKIFVGKADYNSYAAWLRDAGAPALPHRALLTAIEVILAISVALHVGAATELAIRARRARPVRYSGGRPKQGYASRTMRTGAILIVIFVSYHLLDLTARVFNPRGIVGDPYDNVVSDFRNPWITVFYVICLLVLGLHIRHGVWSALATLGRNSVRRQKSINLFAVAFSTVLIAGFLAVPLSIAFGMVTY